MFIKNIDAFGQNITMSYKGTCVYKTLCGGLSTIVLGIFVLFYFFTKV